MSLEARVAALEGMMRRYEGSVGILEQWLSGGGEPHISRFTADSALFDRLPLGFCAFDVNQATEQWPAWRYYNNQSQWRNPEACLTLGTVGASDQAFNVSPAYAARGYMMVLMGFFAPGFGVTTGTYYFSVTDNTGKVRTVEHTLTTNQTLVYFNFFFPITRTITTLTVTANGSATTRGGELLAFLV